MANAFIGLGSNLGDGRENLSLAWGKLTATVGRSLGISSPWLSEPVDMESDFIFTNAVGLLETLLEPQELLIAMLDLEKQLGRDRGKSKDRTIDLDVLFYDDLVRKTPSLVLPHPEIANRLFVVAPLAELAPDFIHPLLQKTAAQMLYELDSEEGVKQISWENV
jgi:2-amino-4-hydroxy-6-hydroxymethyldihydropteridine diphosphokinase